MTHPLKQALADTALVDDPALLSELARLLGVGCWHWTPEQGLLRDGNCVRLLGFEPGGLDDLGWLDRVHPDDVERVQQRFNACQQGEVPEYQHQYRILHHDGQYRLVWERVLRCEPGQRLVGLVHGLAEPAAESVTLIPVSDPLTGAESRQRCEARLQQLLQQAPDAPLSLMMLEVDYLDKVRQLYGTDTADELLGKLVRRVRQWVGEGVSLARWQEDRFLLLLPDLDQEAAVALGEQLRQQIAEANLLPNRPVTASLGVVTRQEGEQVDHLLARLATCHQAARAQHNRLEA